MARRQRRTEMKVTVNKETYEYFKDLIEGNGQRLIESWKEYIDDDVDFKCWGDLLQAVATKVEYSSAQMVAKLLRGEIKIEEKKEPTRFVYYKERGFTGNKVRRYYGSMHETAKAIDATWYDTRLSHDERQMEALETLGWKKITLSEAQQEDKYK